MDNNDKDTKERIAMLGRLLAFAREFDFCSSDEQEAIFRVMVEANDKIESYGHN